MKPGIVYVLAMALLLPSALAKKEKKTDPRLKSVHTIFVNGKEDSWVTDAHEALERGKCFRLAPNADSADAVMTVLSSLETEDYVTGPRPLGGVGEQVPVGSTEKVHRSTVILKLNEGGKLKKVWTDTVGLSDSDETKKSGIQRLIEKLSHEACTEP